MLRQQHRRGNVYMLVLGACMLVTVIGVTAVMAARLQHHAASDAAEIVEARLHARSAVNLALHLISKDSDWRTTYGNSNWPEDEPIADGTLTIEVLDPVDGNVPVGNADPLVVTGIGMQGDAVQRLEVTLDPDDPPMAALGTCLHCPNQLDILPGKTLTVIGAPASTNANFDNDGVLYGDVDANTMSGSGTVTGSANVPAPPKSLPPASVFTQYVALATTIPYSGNIDTMVLAPGVNEYGGGLDPDGCYHIATGGNDLTIKGSRIHGTLVIDAGTKTVTVDNQVLMQSYRTNYPVLIVKGDLVLTYTSTGGAAKKYLREIDWGHNFNPSGAPYDDETDSDQFDIYPSEIEGLVHATRVVTLKSTSHVRGAVLGEFTVNVEEHPTITHDPALLSEPPLGYTVYTGAMRVRRGTWAQTVGP